MEDGSSRYKGPFSMLKRKTLRQSEKQQSRKLRNILGEQESFDSADGESVGSMYSGGMYSSQASDDVDRNCNSDAKDRLREGKITNLPGIATSYEIPNKGRESSLDNAEEIVIRQKHGQLIVYEECNEMSELTKRIERMNGTIEADKNSVDMHCLMEERLDAAEKVAKGKNEDTDFNSTVSCRPSLVGASEEVRQGKDAKLAKRKHNLFYHEAEEGRIGAGLGIRATLSNGDSFESKANMSHDHNGNNSDNKSQGDRLLTTSGERQSSGIIKKRYTTSNGSDVERKMGSPLSSRSSSVRSHSSSLPASIDSGLRMGFQEPHTSIVVVAIDFGTTYSGYAFAFTRDPDSIHMMRKWEGGDPGVNNQKIPTTLLLKSDGSFHSFGYGARDFYHDLEPAEAKKWLYFEKFKMSLHSSEVRK